MFKLREEFLVAVGQRFVMAHQYIKGGTCIFEVGCPAHQSFKTVPDAFFKAVVVQPVLRFHIGEHALEMLGEIGRGRFQQLVGVARKAVQVLLRMEDGHIVRQEMIVHDVDECGGIQPVIFPEKCGGCLCGGMGVGECIYFTVKLNAQPDGIGIVEFLSSFYKIADHVPGEDAGIVERKVSMCEEVQGMLNFGC